jgi:hypothetical protein
MAMQLLDGSDVLRLSIVIRMSFPAASVSDCDCALPDNETGSADLR